MKYKMETDSPSGKVRVSQVDQSIAWHAAQGVAANSQHAVVLHGRFGVATFNPRGGGSILWNEKSTMPGQTTEFSSRATVLI